MIFRRLIALLSTPPPSPPAFTPDLDGDDTDKLRAEFRHCLDRTGGTLTTARRAEALSELFLRLTPAGQHKYVNTLRSLDAGAPQTTSDRYSQIEEAELFGRSSSKLAILDAFDPPQRRILGMLSATRDGARTIQSLRSIADDELKSSIDTL